MTLFVPRASAVRAVSRSAFTLVELIVAMGVTALLLTFMLGMVPRVMGVWDRTNGSLSTRAQADLILEHLSRDLESAVFRRDGGVWFAATIQPSPQPSTGDAKMSDAVWSGRMKPTNDHPGAPGSSLNLAPESGALTDFRFGQAGLWLRFVTTQPDTQSSMNNLSAPRAVAYQLVRRRITASASAATPSSAPLRYVLYRSSSRPMSPTWPDINSTFAVGYDLFAAASGIGYNLADSSQIDQVGNIRAPRRYEQIIGNNVIDFGVRCWVRSPEGVLIERFPALTGSPSGHACLGFAATTKNGFWSAKVGPPAVSSSVPLDSGDLSFGFPERVDVLIRILTDKGARIIEAFEAGLLSRPTEVPDDDAYWWELALQHSHVFTQQIKIPSRAL